MSTARNPKRRLAVVACMDARLDPARLLGLDEGDAHVIRNPGGVIGDAEIRALAISQHLMGTEEIVVIQHTDCGMAGFKEDEFAERVEGEAGERPQWPSGPQLDLREALERLRTSPFLPNRSSIRGLVYDVETGELTETK